MRTNDGLRDDAAPGRWVLVGAVSQLPDESAVRVEVAGHSICLTRSQGLVRALLDECSHGQVALSEGDVEDGYVECWLHGSRFDLGTGVPTGPPATAPVPVYPVRVTDAGIEIALGKKDSDAEVVANRPRP